MFGFAFRLKVRAACSIALPLGPLLIRDALNLQVRFDLEARKRRLAKVAYDAMVSWRRVPRDQL